MSESHAPLEILVVDDDPNHLRVITEMTRRAIRPAQIYQAHSGRQAIELVQQHHANLSLVILDLVMPVLSGITVAARIRRDWPHIRILPITAFTEYTSLVEALGTLPAIRKPAEVRATREALTAALATAVEPPPNDAYCTYLITEASRLSDTVRNYAARVIVIARSEIVREGLKRIAQRAGGELIAAGVDAEEILGQQLEVIRDFSVIVCPLRDQAEAQRLAQAIQSRVLIVLSDDDLPLTDPRTLTANAIHEAYPITDLTQALALTEIGQPFHKVPEYVVLSSTERQVLQLIGDGRGTAAIAERLSTSDNRVRQLRSQLYEKTGAQNLAALALIARDILRFGWNRTAKRPPAVVGLDDDQSDR